MATLTAIKLNTLAWQVGAASGSPLCRFIDGDGAGTLTVTNSESTTATFFLKKKNKNGFQPVAWIILEAGESHTFLGLDSKSDKKYDVAIQTSTTAVIDPGNVDGDTVDSGTVIAATGEYYDVVPTSGLVVWLKMNETSGTTAADSSANANDGTITGSVDLNQTALISDAGAASMNFAFSTSEYISFASTDSWGDSSADFSISIHFQASRHNGTDSPTLLTLKSTTSAFRIFTIDHASYRDINVGWSSGDGGKFSFNVTDFAINTTYHLILIWDSTAQTFVAWINGTQYLPSSEADTFVTCTNHNRLGANSISGWDGLISEFSLWSRQLTQTEVYQLINYASLGATTPPATTTGGLVPGANTTLVFPLDD